jgi:hypothetical protein
MSDFERVTTGQIHRDSATLAVYPDGYARLNTAAVEQWFSDVSAVQVFVDHDADRLGLACAPDGVDGRSLTDDGRGATISLKSVLSDLDIDAELLASAVHLPLDHDRDEGLLIADLAPLREAIDDA